MDCTSYNVSYIGEVTHYLSTRIAKRLEKNKKPHIFNDLNENHDCKSLSNLDCLQIIGSASSKFKLKLKEAMYITGTNSSTNRQLKHMSLSITV